MKNKEKIDQVNNWIKMGVEFMNSIFADMPMKKEDKPLLVAMGPLVYDYHDVDGLYYMLDRRLSGCMIFLWSKQMNPEIKGRVIVNDKSVGHTVLTSMHQMNGMWILGIPLRGVVTEAGKKYELHVDGFQDIDGNKMDPQNFQITAKEKVVPEEKFKNHEMIAKQAAIEGTVLLENRNQILPLEKGTVLNLFGKGIYQFRNGAVGAGKITPRYSINFAEAIQDSDYFDLNQDLMEFYRCDTDQIPSEDILERAVKKSDIAIIMLTRAAGENMDNSSSKGEYYLSCQEEMLVKKVSEIFSHVVAILNVGYPIDMSFVDKYKVEGVLYCGFGGMLAGPALVDLLSGKENPSGKLPDTWAKDYFDIPSSRNFYDCVDKPRLDAESTAYVDTCYEEDIYVGYRYFDTFKKKVRYPFGYGLSYSDFDISVEKIDYDSEFLNLKVKIKNVGKRAGKEVVQIYIGKPETREETPKKELVAFEKTKKLEKGEEQAIQFRIPKKHMGVYSTEAVAYILQEGTYEVYVGNDTNAPKSGDFVVEKEETLKNAKSRMKCPVKFKRLSKRDYDGYPKGEFSGVKDGVQEFEPMGERMTYPALFTKELSEEKVTFDDVRQDLSKAEAFVTQLTVEEMARLAVCASDGWGMEGIGEAGRVYKIEHYDIPDFPVSDGNSGVNLRIPNIGMPSGVTICASFNKKLAEDIGKVIGEEAKELGMPMILAPALNIHRNPLNGRQPEYFSEDPYLAGMMAGNYSKGMEQAGTASCMKHLVANNCETSRKRNQSLVGERALREIYFKAFEYAMEVHMPAAVMTAYNACNGKPTAADPDLILGLLREENGFDGMVMTDWGSYDTVKITEMVESGNCWITPGSTDTRFTDQIIEGVKRGEIQLARLQENTLYLIRTMARFA